MYDVSLRTSALFEKSAVNRDTQESNVSSEERRRYGAGTHEERK